VQWSGVRIRLKKSAGSALKFFGNTPLPNLVTYSLLLGLSYLMLTDAGIIGPPAGRQSHSQAELSGGSLDPERLGEAPLFVPELNDVADEAVLPDFFSNAEADDGTQQR
jgi:hypothetical protein